MAAQGRIENLYPMIELTGERGIPRNEMDLDLPEISVILPVYNGADTLERSIESILNQTFSNFELIIINDGSTDRSPELCSKYTDDKRVRIYNQENQGLANTLNRGIKLSRSKFIARQDSDDVSLPDRLAIQLKHMLANPKTVLLGTWSKIFLNNKDTMRRHHHPTQNRSLRLFLYFDNPFVHSSIMMRKDACIAAGGYKADDCYQPEDYDLWTRMASLGDVENLPFYGLEYHEVPLSISRKHEKPFPLIYQISKRYFLSNTNSTQLLSDQWAKCIWKESQDLKIRLLIVCFFKIVYREKTITKWFLKKMCQLLKFQISQIKKKNLL